MVIKLKLRLIVCGLVVLLLNCLSYAQQARLTNGWIANNLSSLSTGGDAYGVQVVGKTAYVAADDAGLKIIDVSNPNAPKYLGGCITGGSAMDVQVNGNYAYVADYAQGLKVVDITNPAFPKIVGKYSTEGLALGLHVVGNTAYVCDGDLNIIDVSNPTALKRLGVYTTGDNGFAWNVQVVGNLAYLAADSDGLQIIDISQPGSPIIIGGYDTDEAHDVCVVGSHVYIADYHSGLQVINALKPKTPYRVGRYDTTDRAVALKVVDNLAYVADLMGGLQIIDIVQPNSPKYLGAYNNFGSFFQDVQVIGNLAYVADTSSGLRIIRIETDVTEPAIITQPLSITVNVGSAATFTVTATGTVPLLYQWYQNGVRIAGANASTYRIAEAQSLNAGEYSVTVSNSAGSVTSIPATLIVNPVATSPRITSQPLSITVNVGSAATFTVTATGTVPLLYQWYHNGARIVGPNSTTYSITNVQEVNAGEYSVTVKTPTGSVSSIPATLVVNPAATPPRIISQPSSVTVNFCSAATFTVTAIGTPPLFYQWHYKGVRIVGANSNAYSLANIREENVGEYYATVSNSAGIATSFAAKMSINPIAKAPEIIDQPQPITVGFNNTAKFTVMATGTLPLVYQWKFNSVDIYGATNSTFMLPMPRLTDAGEYTVFVENMFGNVTSKAAAMVVKPFLVGSNIWEFSTKGAVRSSPAIGLNGNIYIGSGDGYVYSLDGSTGTNIWKFKTSGEVWSSPAIASNSTVYIGSNDGNVYALNGDNGEIMWVFKTGNPVESSPAIGSNGWIYVGSRDKRVYALNGTSGKKEWEYTTGGEVYSSPAVGFDGTVYIGSYDKNVYALDGTTGVKKWSFPTGGSVYSSPAIGADGTVYVIGLNGSNILYALNGSTGAKIWEFKTQSSLTYSSPAIGFNGIIYIGGYDQLYAISSENGNKIWGFNTGHVVWSSPAIGVDGTVYVGSHNYGLYALDGITGILKWKYSTPAGEVRSSPTIGPDGAVYFGSYNGKTYAIGSDSKGLAKSAWPKFHANNQNTGKTGFRFGAMTINFSSQSGLNLDIPVSPSFETILEYSSDLNQWIEKQRFGRQSNTPSIVVPLKMDQTKSMEYWRTRNQ